MYLIYIPVRMLTQEFLEYWALVIDVTQRPLPNLPRILSHVSAVYCHVMHCVEQKLCYCRDSSIIWLRRVYCFSVIDNMV